MMKKIRYIGQAILSLTLVLTMATPAHAILSESILDYYNLNGIYYYNESGAETCIIGAGSYNGQTSAGLTETQAAFVDTYHDIAQQLSIEYGIPWETVMAQGILESGAGTSDFAIYRNNFFGIGAFDSNPNKAFSYDSPMEGWKGYYENIRKTSTYRRHGVFTGNNITDPYAYLITIKNSGYATDPDYINKTSVIILAIENRAKENGWASSAELAQQYPEMLTNAANNAAGNGTEVVTDMSYVGATCIVNGGNGDINQTALELAWPDYRVHDKNDPKPSYQTALAATNLVNYNDKWVKVGASCDAYVAAVFRYSGVDPNFYCCGIAYGQSGGVHSYLVNHPELYQYAGSGNDASNAQPGDIRIRPGHIEIVVQRPDGTLGIASASYGDRTAEVNHWFVESGYSYDLYRFIGNNSKNSITQF